MKEIVIKIPDKVYESVIEEGFSVRNARELIHAMVNGKVLPKGHGELKDVSKLKENYHTVFNEDFGISEDVVNLGDIDEAPTLVEADKGEE